MLFVSSRRRHTRCALVTGVLTCCSSDLTPPFRLIGGTLKWLRSWVRAALRVAMLPAAATRPQYLRHFEASIVQLMGPDARVSREDRMTKAWTISAAGNAMALALAADSEQPQPAEAAYALPSTRTLATESDR